MAYEITDGGKVVVHNLQGNVEVKEAPTRVEVKTAIVHGGGGGVSNDFIVTISWNDSTQLWEPDCTVYEWQDAYEGGKTIAIECSDGNAVNWYSDDDYVFIYNVYSWDGNSLIESLYIFTVDGVEHDGDTETIAPVFASPTRTYTPTTSKQTETITFDPSTYNGIQQVGVTVNAMPTGTAGTPTATKGTVSNHAVSVTPSVTNTAGYITGGTKTGTAVSVAASELVSGSLPISSNNTYDVTNYASAVVNVSGGASNFVTGTFTTGSSTGVAATFSTGYTGSGYPIALMIWVDGGPYNNGTGGNTTWYNSVQRYAIGLVSLVKSQTTTTPTYATSGAANYGTIAVIYKNSTSQATTYSRTSSMTANSFTSSSTNANSTATTTVRFKGDGKTVTYFVASTSYGLLASTKYAYCVLYSS